MKMKNMWAATALWLAAGAAGGVAANAQTPAPAKQMSAVQTVPALIQAQNVVLVHGAWADGSSWAKVIPILQAAGLHVTSVQNPLTSLTAADVETRRVLAEQNGPTVLVAHSWSGTIISDVGDNPKVSALVYVAARAPDADENFVTLSAKFPTTPVRAGVVKDGDFTTLTEAAFTKYFANGIPHSQAEVLFAEQEPTAALLFADRTTAAAWHDKPTFYAVSKQDMTINPDLERFLGQTYARHHH
jgi:pimeloyl-ACP methyl ester carboxylesterase